MGQKNLICKNFVTRGATFTNYKYFHTEHNQTIIPQPLSYTAQKMLHFSIAVHAIVRVLFVRSLKRRPYDRRSTVRAAFV